MAVQKICKKCFLVEYSYTDAELGNRTTLSDYVKDLQGLIEYLQDVKLEHQMVDTAHFACREDITFKIKQVFIPEKKYVSLFK